MVRGNERGYAGNVGAEMVQWRLVVVATNYTRAPVRTEGPQSEAASPTRHERSDARPYFFRAALIPLSRYSIASSIIDSSGSRSGPPSVMSSES